LRYALLPSPQLTLERVSIGALEDVKVSSLIVSGSPFAFFAAEKSFGQVEANLVTVEQEALAGAMAWLKPPGSATPVHVGRVRLKRVQLNLKAIEIPPFDADVSLAHDGTFQKAVLGDSRVKVDVVPKDQALHVNLDARGWQLPILPGIEFDDLAITAVLTPNEASVTRFDGQLGAGKLRGDGKASWGNGWRMRGTFALTNADLGRLMSAFTRSFSASGTVSANGNYALQGDTVAALLSSPRVEATFNIEKGSLGNVDLVRAIQSPSRDGVRGGKTLFTVLAGSMRAGGGTYSFRQLNLNSGQMNATGNVEVAADGGLSGHVSAEIGTRSVIVARGTLAVSGNVTTPVLR
jgi:uncharacterized protein involved in outer membrane biogenesis